MKNLLIPLAPDFEEIEAVTVVDILRRSGAKVCIAGTITGLIEESRGLKIASDVSLDNIKTRDLGLIVISRDQPGTDNLMKDKRIKGLLIIMHEIGKLISAICAALIILEANGIIDNRKRTSHPSVKNKLI